MASMGYDALTFHETTLLYMGTGVIGVVLYLLILLSYFHLPNIKAQHPAVDIVVWHVVSALMTCIGFVMAYCSVDPQVEVILSQRSCTLLAVYNQFWALASVLWYLMLTLDLFVALVNPWMGYACKSWAYHTIVWSVSVVMAFVVYQQRLDGVSSLNLCWIQRTEDPAAINHAQWICLFGFIIATFVISLAVLLFASFRFARRQLDVTYRSKRRVLLQYYRYLIIFGGYWGSCAALYYAAYLEHFHGSMARRIQLALGIVAGSYPVLFLFAWILNTELYQNRSSENSLTSAEREAENYGKTEHFSAALRKDLMRYTTAGIRCSINDDLGDMKSPVTSRSRVDSIASSIFSMDDGESAGLYSEKRRLATTVYNGEYRYYEKLGFTDYAPRIFQNIREACDLEDNVYEQSFAGTLLERASEGKSGMLFYFTSDRKYLVKTMTKREHSFLLKILPLYHQYILKQPNTLLCRILGCHSMQLPVGWNRMFFVVMENVFADGPVDERYDLKGIFHQSALTSQSRELEFRRRNHGQDVTMYECDDSGLDCDEIDFDDSTTGEASSPVRSRYEMHWRTEAQPLLPRTASRSSLRYDSDFVCRCAALQVNATTRANLLAQITNDCGFLQELGIMDYSFLLGIQKHATRVDPTVLSQLAHNAVVSEDQTKIYYLGFVDILQHYNFGWKVQHWVLSTILDKRKITALPPAEYALRFLGFIHSYLLSGWDSSTTRSYGSVDLSMLPGTLRKLYSLFTMQRDELQTVLTELCDDLFQCSASNDAVPILRSLVTLVVSFPLAQKVLGKSLESKKSSSSGKRAASRTQLETLTDRFLYDRHTAVLVMQLLAALAHENVPNQKKIVRRIPGVCIKLKSPTCGRDRKHREDLIWLYVLTLPTTLRRQYKQWNQRRRELSGRRVPSGEPPKSDGVPAPCHCDQCLGTAQLLPTWLQHFQDLSRWTTEAQEDETPVIIREPKSTLNPTKLPSGVFLESVLHENFILHDSVVVPVGDEENNRHVKPRVVHFIPREETVAVPEQQGVIPVDPFVHVCAISVHPSVAEMEKVASGSPQQVVSCDQKIRCAVDRVILLETHVALTACYSALIEGPKQEPTEDMSGTMTVHKFLSVSEAITDVPISTRKVIPLVTAFLGSDFPLSLGVVEQIFGIRIPLTVEEPASQLNELRQSIPEPCFVRITADFTMDMIEISCRTRDEHEYAISLDIKTVFGSEIASTPTMLLSVGDECLGDLLVQTRICRNDCCQKPVASTHFCLRPRDIDDMRLDQTPQQDVDQPLQRSANTAQHSVPLHGLATATVKVLEKLGMQLQVEGDYYADTALKQLVLAIHQCDDRIATLARSHQRAESYQAAGRERCRRCRDFLFELCKKIKLQSAPETTVPDTIRVELKARAKETIRSTIARVLDTSTTFDAWETPDERVAQLGLDRRTWASGCPDAEFYVEKERRNASNRRKQEQLTRKLREQVNRERQRHR